MTENPASPTPSPVVSLGTRLKRVREATGMSLRSVARQLGVSASFLSQLENGKSQPSVATLYSLAQLLGVSIDELFAQEVQTSATLAAASGSDVGDLGKVAGGTPIAEAIVTGFDGSARDRTPADASPQAHGALISRSGLGALHDAFPRGSAPARLSHTRPGERHVLEMDSGVIWERLADNTGTGLDFIEIIYPPHSSSTNDRRMLRHVGSEFGYVLEGELEITVGFDVVTVRAGESIGFDSSVPHLLANRTDRPARGIWCVRHSLA